MPSGKVKSEFVVLQYESATPGEGCKIAARGFKSTALALKALEDGGGEDGYTYQVAIFRGDPVRVAVETVTKRKLTPVGE